MPDLKKVRVITIDGLLYWIHIIAPGTLNFDEDGMEYICTLVLSPIRAQELLEQINTLYAANTKDIYELKSAGWKKCTEGGKVYKEKENLDPKLFTHYAFRWHTKTTYKDGNPVVIGVYNKNDVLINMGAVRIGNGSKGAISGTIKYYVKTKAGQDGISLFLEDVQLIDLEEYVPEPEFGEKEGSYVGKAAVVEKPRPAFINHSKLPAESSTPDGKPAPENTFDKDDFQDPNGPPFDNHLPPNHAYKDPQPPVYNNPLPADDPYNDLTDDDIPY